MLLTRPTLSELFDVFWPDEVDEWCDVAEALEVERHMQDIHSSQFSYPVPGDSEVATARKSVLTGLDDFRSQLMGGPTSTEKLVSSTHAWIDAKKRAKEKEAPG